MRPLAAKVERGQKINTIHPLKRHKRFCGAMIPTGSFHTDANQLRNHYSALQLGTSRLLCIDIEKLDDIQSSPRRQWRF